MSPEDSSGEAITLIYDAQCPACSHYARLVRIKKELGELVFIDAREVTPFRLEIDRRGWNLDEGMVLKIGDQMAYGEDALHQLALMSSRSGVFNRLNFWIFRSARISQRIYPILRTGRNLLLLLLRKSKINNLDMAEHDQF